MATLNPSYNLVDDKWIPCELQDGSLQNRSLKQVFTSLDEVIDIKHHSPLVKMSVYRLLITIAQRCMKCRELNDLARLWDTGLNQGQIADYFDQWKHRFDIFDNVRPFYQIPNFHEGAPTTVHIMMHEKASHNNATLFDHSFDENTIPIDPPEAALLLLACQTYGVGGGKSSTAQNFRHAPLVGKAPLLLKGKNLGETVRLNLVSYDPEHPRASLMETLDVKEKDIPVWEMDRASTASSLREPYGLLDYYTWQSRAIRLLPEEEKGRIVVRKVYYSQGVELVDSENMIRDPMVAYRRSEDRGMLPQKLDISKAQWRSLPALLHSVPTVGKMPKTVEMVGSLIQVGKLCMDARFRIEVLGLISNKAKINQWSQATMPLPARFIIDNQLVSEIEQAVKYSERVGAILRMGTVTLAKNIMPRGDTERIYGFVDSLDLEREYWSRLETHFYVLMDRLAKETMPIGVSKRGEIIQEWAQETVRGNAKYCFEKGLRTLEANVKNLKASVLARSTFYGQLKQASAMIGG